MLDSQNMDADCTCSVGDRQVDPVGEEDRQAVGLTTSRCHVKAGHRKHKIVVPAAQ